MKRGKVLAGVACFLFLFCITGLFAQEGFLRITSVPENVSVEVDGKAVGKTPLLTVLKPGKHAVKADLAGYSSETETIEILENEVTIMNITMEKQRTVGRVSPWTKGGTGNLTVISDWADVDIYVDGLKVNEKPPSTIKNISAGLHTVILVSGSYADSSRVFIQSGKTFVLKKNFEDDKKKASSGSKIGDLWSGRRRTSDIEAKRQALPARVVLKLAKPEAKETSLILGEGESMVVSFQYRKSGETDWTAKELQSGTKEDDTFTL
ncbi:MAG TPA: PEGA domain-containing protein, partial [bacterium]|nr:PEGA domain-containing protein [bacterium]